MALFIGIAALFTLAVLALALYPLWPARRGLALGIGGVSVVAVLGLYLLLGRPEAIGYVPPPAPQADQVQQLDQALAELEAVVRAEPANQEARVLLARSYMQLGRPAEAQPHFAEALARDAGNAALMVDYAESLFRAGKPDVPDARAREWIDKAIAAEPGNQRARFFRGILLLQAGQAAEAAKAWEALLPELDRQTAQALLPQINQARAQAGQPSLSESVLPAAMTVQVTVELDPALRAATPPGAVLFVFAKRVDGGGPPVAAKRLPVSAFPVQLALSDADSIMPTATLSSQAAFTLSARISASGSAEAGAGDWQSETLTVQSDKLAPVTLVLRKQP